MLLQLQQATWAAIFKQDAVHFYSSLDVRLENSDLESIVNLAELVQATFPAQYPSFTFDADLIPPLSFVAFFSDNANLLRRVITLLRLLRRKEGIWDSNEVADIFEVKLMLYENHMWSDKYGRGGILGMIKAFQSLGVSCINHSNSLLRFASTADHCIF
ncbi:hypothetical protein Plec18170_004214 [Paecilomyces lecythidis]